VFDKLSTTKQNHHYDLRYPIVKLYHSSSGQLYEEGGILWMPRKM